MMMKECRRLAPVPRELSWRMRRDLALPTPLWVKLHRDPMKLVCAQYPRLLREGRIVWGSIVQANCVLWEPSPQVRVAPANAIYSFDPYFDRHPSELGTIASFLASAKGHRVDDPDLQLFGDELATETKRTFGLAIPPSLTGGHHAFFTTILITSRHVPHGYLARTLFPLLVLPRETSATAVLPWWFWPAELVAHWER